VLNKTDIGGEDEHEEVAALESYLKKQDKVLYRMSAATREGVDEVSAVLYERSQLARLRLKALAEAEDAKKTRRVSAKKEDAKEKKVFDPLKR